MQAASDKAIKRFMTFPKLTDPMLLGGDNAA